MYNPMKLHGKAKASTQKKTTAKKILNTRFNFHKFRAVLFFT